MRKGLRVLRQVLIIQSSKSLSLKEGFRFFLKELFNNRIGMLGLLDLGEKLDFLVVDSRVFGIKFHCTLESLEEEQEFI